MTYIFELAAIFTISQKLLTETLKTMNSTLTSDDIEKFFIRLYFDISKGFIHAAMQRAYRDFNRTIENIPKDDDSRTLWRHELYSVLSSQVDKLLSQSFVDQEEFTLWHQSTCFHLVENSNKVLTIGQAQKWINMTLKYLYALGDKRVNGIARNYQYFHIPIDNIIQGMLQQKFGVGRLKMVWSKIPDYETYYNYQKEVRLALKDQIVMDEEFKMFNQS